MTPARCRLAAALLLAAGCLAGILYNLEDFLFSPPARNMAVSGCLTALVLLSLAALAWLWRQSRGFVAALSVYFGVFSLLLGAAVLLGRGGLTVATLLCLAPPAVALLLPLGGLMLSGAEWLVFAAIPLAYLLALSVWLAGRRRERKKAQ